ncbi:3-carboxy-cis,cis-muconate cycloisomerase [Phaeobacter sp.]|uniref:3-carboxy-cis,cis-muconate cycloisomerase n=1 Tax=Phaeobacter sp. TaxID=1902409 RepID=UPI0025DD09A8|nr:3-carboxy-cis,cis-muconate cycloisomerase [Phaeobacter sp.]
MTSVFEHPFLGSLFGDRQVAEFWSEKQQLEHYRAFECALARAVEDAGLVPEGVGKQAAEKIAGATTDITRLAKNTGRDGVPIPDFVRQLKEQIPQNDAVHFGATSQDVMDTSLSLTLQAQNTCLLERLDALDHEISGLKDTFGTAPLMARTRMQAAQPILVPDRLEVWKSALQNQSMSLSKMKQQVEKLQLGGAVGTRSAYGSTAEQIVQHMAETLNLAPCPVWHADRGALAHYAGTLSGISGACGKIGQDICLMAQQGVDEIALANGGSSSAMPHKSNPILAELLVTLARFNATQIAGMHQALLHEQERSGSAWMLELMILPQMSVTTGRALSACSELLSQVRRIGDNGSVDPINDTNPKT